MSEHQLREYLRQNLKVEVLDPTVFRDCHCRIDPHTPTVRVRLMLEGEVLSEDDVRLEHHHGWDSM